MRVLFSREKSLLVKFTLLEPSRKFYDRFPDHCLSKITRRLPFLGKSFWCLSSTDFASEISTYHYPRKIGLGNRQIFSSETNLSSRNWDIRSFRSQGREHIYSEGHNKMHHDHLSAWRLGVRSNYIHIRHIIKHLKKLVYYMYFILPCSHFYLEFVVCI